ncbi:hypothetical protein T492DRAFT_893331 [Pavlovales sp. CCMP2436]|nr:hypothetical protein T492DRAFT_893331 [Pavlovales sp. CCMP2436]
MKSCCIEIKLCPVGWVAETSKDAATQHMHCDAASCTKSAYVRQQPAKARANAGNTPSSALADHFTAALPMGTSAVATAMKLLVFKLAQMREPRRTKSGLKVVARMQHALSHAQKERHRRASIFMSYNRNYERSEPERSIKGPMIRAPDDLMRKDHLIKALYPNEFIDYVNLNTGVLAGLTTSMPVADRVNAAIVNDHLATVYLSSTEQFSQGLTAVINMRPQGILTAIEIINENKSMEIFVQDLYHFAREIITAHDCKTFDTGAQILTSVQCLKQVYMPIMQMGPSQFDQLMQLNATHSTPALSFLLAHRAAIKMQALAAANNNGAAAQKFNLSWS